MDSTPLHISCSNTMRLVKMRSFFAADGRRCLGVAAVRAYARHRLDRVQYVGVPREVVQAMRQRAERRERGLGREPAMRSVDFFSWQTHQHAPAA